ncbi:histidine phosphatase family protein [Jeongeupia naejangsanensis]|uniref:Histidine phosphatase family protein n=1 Tax=Jeongeupia naejangsanensis TaxID=613195 RepID=A0ABS2BJQ3_9NEIS|nr:histidine phosphatase family protein [Jeongeupia naejangsanensis]MBM3115826.1 histidine phosphatase family protein [Jeongeupia naejangsanensis]
MSRTIYLLRHGQTEFNTVRRLQGRCDSPLTALGQEQASAMGEALRAELGSAEGWAMRVSPLPRAQASAARVAAALGLPATAMTTDERIIEVGFGDWEQQLRADLVAQHPVLETAPDWHFHSPNGEKLDEVLARIDAFLCDASLPQKLIVVSHGLFGRLLRARYLGLQGDALFTGEMPQDAFYRLHGGDVARIDCAGVTA